MDGIVNRKNLLQNEGTVKDVAENTDVLGDDGCVQAVECGELGAIVEKAETPTKSTRRKRKKEVPVYSVAELVESGGFSLRRELVSVALRTGGKEKYSLQEAEALISAMKERKV